MDAQGPTSFISRKYLCRRRNCVPHASIAARKKGCVAEAMQEFEPRANKAQVRVFMDDQLGKRRTVEHAYVERKAAPANGLVPTK